MKITIAFALAIVAACACRTPAGGPSSAPDEACAAACANLDRHHCARAVGEGGVEGCTAFCRAETSLGKASQLRPECVADAGTEQAMHACNVRCDGWQ